MLWRSAVPMLFWLSFEAALTVTSVIMSRRRDWVTNLLTNNEHATSYASHARVT